MENIDYLAEAGREIVRTDEYWGRIKVAAAPMAFSGKGQKPAPYDPILSDTTRRVGCDSLPVPPISMAMKLTVITPRSSSRKTPTV